MGSKGIRYTEVHISRILKDVDSDISVSLVYRKYELAEKTAYRWQNKYDGPATREMQRLREFEAENSRFKRIVVQ